MGDKEVDRHEFLSVVVRMWDVKYKQVVEYCLEMDQKLRRRSFHPRDINVTKPCRKYYGGLVNGLGI
jgi:hypothetical protein